MSIVERIVNELGPWNWWILGLVLLGLEVLAPGSFFIWFGIAAILVGTVALTVDLSWQASVGLFIVLSLISVFAGRKLMRSDAEEEGDPALNKRGSRYIGRVFVLQEPLHEGAGKLNIGDTVWRITGPDLPAGTRVRVDGLEGAQLSVSRAPEEE